MLSSDYHQMSRGISQGNQAIRKPHLIDSGKECVHTPYLRLYRRQRSSRLSVMAPPADFSYGPTDPDADACYAARDCHGVQFPQCQMDQWKAVLPGINWIQVHGEEGLTRGACCRLVAMAAWSSALPPIVASIVERCWSLEFIAAVCTALLDLPIDWSPTAFSVLMERVRDHLLHASESVLALFKFGEAQLCELQADPDPTGTGTSTGLPAGEAAARQVRWCDLRSASGFYEDAGYLEDHLDPRMTASSRGVAVSLAGNVTRSPSPYSALWARLLAAVIAGGSVASGDPSVDIATAMADLLTVSAPEPELRLMCTPGRDAGAELRMRFTYAASDKSRAAGVIKFLPNVVAHHSAFALVFCTGEERALPLGAAGTASAAVTAHADQFDIPPRDECTLAMVRSLELAWRPQTAMLEGAEMRAMSVPQRLAHLRGLVVADRATSAATVGDMGVLSLTGAGNDKSSKGRLGVPAHYDPMRRAELAAPHFVALVNELLSVNAAGGSNRSKDVVELALLGGALCYTSSFIYQMTCGTYDSDAVAPAISFLSADAANGKAAVVGRAVARTLSRNKKDVPPSMLSYADAELTRQLESEDWSAVNFGQALARAQAHRLAAVDEDPVAVVVSVTEQFSSKVKVEEVYDIVDAVLPLFRYPGRPDPDQDLGGSVAGSGSSRASRALTVRRAEEVDRDPSDYYFQDALLDVAERFREHGGTPERDAVLAIGVVAFLHGALRVMGARYHRAAHSKNPQAKHPDMILDQDSLNKFRQDEADLKQVLGQRRAKEWSRVLDQADAGANGVASPAASRPAPPAAKPGLATAAGDKRGREAVSAAPADAAVERPVPDELVHAGSVSKVKYWNRRAWRVDNGRGGIMFYDMEAEEAWFTSKGLDISKYCRKRLISSGTLAWHVSCDQPVSTDGHASANDACHVVPAGYKPGLFRISSVDGAVGSRQGGGGGGGGGGSPHGGGRGRGAPDPGGRGRGRGKGGAPPGDGRNRGTPDLGGRGRGRGGAAPPGTLAAVSVSAEGPVACFPSDDEAERRASAPLPPSVDTRAEWTIGQMGLGAPYPTGDPRWCEVTASGTESAHFPEDRRNALRVADLRREGALRPDTFPPLGEPQCAQCALSSDVPDDVALVQVVPTRAPPDHECEWVKAECGHCPRTWWVCAPGRNPGNGCGAEWGCGIDHDCTGSAGYRGMGHVDIPERSALDQVAPPRLGPHAGPPCAAPPFAIPQCGGSPRAGRHPACESPVGEYRACAPHTRPSFARVGWLPQPRSPSR